MTRNWFAKLKDVSIYVHIFYVTLHLYVHIYVYLPMHINITFYKTLTNGFPGKEFIAKKRISILSNFIAYIFSASILSFCYIFTF